MSTVAGEQRTRLFAAKLAALVRARWGEHRGAAAIPFRGGAGLCAGPGEPAWVLAEVDVSRALGAALAWAVRQRAGRLELLLGDGGPIGGATAGAIAGDLARRAGQFTLECEVWQVEGTTLVQVPPAPVRPEPPLPPAVARFGEWITAAGAEAVAEHGVLTGEILGLEVCRVVPDDAGGWRLAVGVGRYDRAVHDAFLARQEGDRTAAATALGRVVAEVRRYRQAEAGPHPANSLATERWLRSVVVANPALVGAAFLVPAPSPVARTDLRQPAPAPAVGEATTGSPLTVVCSAGGIDLDLVPVAADARLAAVPDGDLVIVVDPAADAPLTRELTSLVRPAASIVVVPADWRGLVT